MSDERSGTDAVGASGETGLNESESGEAAAKQAAPAAIGLDRRLLELLVCPVTRTPLVLDAERGELLSRAARLAYPVREGIPIMLVEEARELDDAEIAKLRAPPPGR